MLNSRITKLLSGIAVILLVSGFAWSEIFAQRAQTSRQAADVQNRGGTTARSSAATRTAFRSSKSASSSLTNKRAVAVDLLFVEFEAIDGNVPKFNGDGKQIEAVLQQMKAKRQLKTLQRIHLSALDGRPATAQIGDRLAQVTGVVNRFGGRAARGGTSRSYAYHNYGTMAQVTPHVADDGSVALELALEKSWPKGGDKPSEPEETVTPPGSATLTSKSSVRLQPGEFQQVALIADDSAGSSRRTVVLVSVQLGKDPAGPKPVSTTTVVNLKHAQASETAIVLEQLFQSPALRIVPESRTNSLVITADAKVTKALTDVIKAIDVPAKKRAE